MQDTPSWLGPILQALSLVVSVLAIVTFIRAGQKSKTEQAETMTTLANTMDTLAAAQLRTDGKVDEHILETKKMKDAMWKRIDEVKEKQTTLCALHTVNHPGQQI